MWTSAWRGFTGRQTCWSAWATGRGQGSLCCCLLPLMGSASRVSQQLARPRDGMCMAIMSGCSGGGVGRPAAVCRRGLVRRRHGRAPALLSGAAGEGRHTSSDVRQVLPTRTCLAQSVLACTNLLLAADVETAVALLQPAGHLHSGHGRAAACLCQRQRRRAVALPTRVFRSHATRPAHYRCCCRGHCSPPVAGACRTIIPCMPEILREWLDAHLQASRFTACILADTCRTATAILLPHMLVPVCRAWPPKK